MSLMNRVRELLEAKKISQASFARKIDVSPQSLSAYMAGRNSPSVETVAKMCSVLGVTPSYLITGVDTESSAQTLVDDDVVRIPMLNVKASCGAGCLTEQVSLVRMIEVSRAWVNRYCGSANLSALQIASVSGDSMEPTLRDGDLVILDTSVTQVYTDSIFAFVYDDCLYIKRFQRIGRKLEVISDNEFYKPFEIDPYDESIFFRVIGKIVTSLSLKQA